MRETTLALPIVGGLAITRAALGLGAGLLLAEHLEPRRRRQLGLGLLAAGVVTTVPLLVAISSGAATPPPGR